MRETLLYGCKIGEPNYMEEILYQCKGYTNKDELINKAKEYANKNGYDRMRVVELNLLNNKTITEQFIESISA
jgi:hypothetical protein